MPSQIKNQLLTAFHCGSTDPLWTAALPGDSRMYTQGVVAAPLAKHSNESARPVVFVGGRVCVMSTPRGCRGWDYGAVAVLSPSRDVDGEDMVVESK